MTAPAPRIGAYVRDEHIKGAENIGCDPIRHAGIGHSRQQNHPTTNMRMSAQVTWQGSRKPSGSRHADPTKG